MPPLPRFHTCHVHANTNPTENVGRAQVDHADVLQLVGTGTIDTYNTIYYGANSVIVKLMCL